MNKIAIAFLLFAFTIAAHAGAYKCIENGRTVYQDHPSAGCLETAIDTKASPVDELLSQLQAEKNSREYRASMNEWEQNFIADKQSQIAAMSERTRQINVETGLIRAQTARINADIGVVHPPVYGTPLFPLPVVVVNQPHQGNALHEKRK